MDVCVPMRRKSFSVSDFNFRESLLAYSGRTPGVVNRRNWALFIEASSASPICACYVHATVCVCVCKAPQQVEQGVEAK